jgi:glycosyltransferase involved in cell wall biosynthesis
VLKLLTGARLIVEIVTSPSLVYIAERARPGLRERIMKAYSDICLHMSTGLADRAHLLYKGQLAAHPLLRNRPNSVFHDFVPVSIIGRADKPEEYVLLAGAPWYLKGADVLVKAFLEVTDGFPDIKLKILGYYPDREELDALIGDSHRIEVLQARAHPEALKVIEGATVMVSASRCEGLSRVLIEGMASGVPLIGSAVGGTPVLIRDGENGFVVPVGDSSALAARLRELLGDASLRRRMGDSGFSRAHSELDESTYVREFASMIRETVERRGKAAQAPESTSHG